MVLSCYHRFDVNYQGPHAPASSTSQTGPTPPAQAMMATPSPASTDSWFLDSGATHHLSHTVANIHNGTSYNGTDSVMVGNGKSLLITQVGHSFLHISAKPFVLHNVLHVPQLTSNLISVSKFCTDNNTILEFHPFSFFVKDKDTKVTLLQGQLERGLYKFPTSSINSPTASSKHQVFLTKTQPTTMLWHQRVGHPSAIILQKIFHTCNISYNSNKTIDVCNACCYAKSHKIPFSLSTSRASSPLELIHANLWGPTPVPSSTGAWYFLLLMDDYSRPPLNAFKQTMVESSLPSGFYLFMALTSPSHQSSHFPVTPAFLFPPSSVLFPSTTSSSPAMPSEPAPTSPLASFLSLPPLIQVPFVDEAAEISTVSLQDSIAPIPSHPMITRSKFGIYKKKTYLTSLIAEPRTVKQVFQDPNWKLAMEQEYQALLKNQTWYLVPPPSNAKIIGCKWVFKLKHKPNGSIDRRLSIALNKRLEPGSTSSAPFSYNWDSNAQGADASLFYFHSTSDIIIISIYVDDILITGSNPPQVHHIISQLSSHFALQDLGDISYFLGIEVTRLPHVLHLNQQRYIHQLLERADLLGAKSASTLGALGKLLSAADGEPLSALDATHYRSLVGALQYITLTRPKISFAVLLLMVFLSMPHHLGLFKAIPMRIGLHVSMIEEALVAFVFFFCTNLISWSSTKQRVVSRSSAKSEYRALAFLAVEVSWVQFLIKELCIPQPNTPLIWCDNISAAPLAANSVFHARSKHIEIDLHFVRDKFSAARTRFSVVPRPVSLRGDDRQAPAPAADSSPL
ncbi:Retrovirus-related Pol polyprotein from transposon RE1 [Vitis vinifera]|uniref:Retrovirus-related Pol polyprotein from transposon RE1 n=1 Tax=Vitis vinifera TaxID=29760 RepID=A0A438G1F2_VITVI|nr:Retrovirus-related Pol polyprotein from transposon RE1 [Vitis vinifera]